MRSDRLANALSVFAIGLLAMAAMSGGTSASWTATTMNPNNVLGTALLSLTNDKRSDGQLVNITDLVPGDTAERTVVITNNGTLGLTYTASIAPQVNTVLWTDLVNGLQVSAKRGVTTLYTGPLKNLALPASSTIAPSGTDTLTFVFSLPMSAGDTMQGATQTFTITYTASGPAGGPR